MLISSCTDKLVDHLNKNVYTMCIDKGNGYEDKREDFDTIYILKSEFVNTKYNEKLKGKYIAFQEGLHDGYWNFDDCQEGFVEDFFK